MAWLSENQQILNIIFYNEIQHKLWIKVRVCVVPVSFIGVRPVPVVPASATNVTPVELFAQKSSCDLTLTVDIVAINYLIISNNNGIIM